MTGDDEKRLAEIRAALASREFCGDPLGMAADLLAMLDAETKRANAWDETIDRIIGESNGYLKAAIAATKRAEEAERRQNENAVVALSLGQQLDTATKRADEAEASARAAREEASKAWAVLVRDTRPGEDWCSGRPEGSAVIEAERVVRERDEARAKLAALHAALTDAAPVAARHDREVAAKALRDLAGTPEETARGLCYHFDSHDLRAEADRIERGEP